MALVMLRRLLLAFGALFVGSFAQAELVVYDWFEYTGRDAAFEQPLPPGHYRNPILSGFHPDPSITHAGDRFYLVHSTFAYFPGIPVFESRDLVHWRQIGNVIDRPSQLDFSKLGVSRGVFAPSIEYRDGLFYVFNTLVDGGGNYVVTAKNPAGPWSDPTWLPELEGGIDPSMFVDDDGRAYVLNNGPPEGTPRYNGHRAIWIQAFERATLQLQGPRKVLVDGGVEPSKNPIWIEGPHIYKRAGWYYLSCAEGGTGPAAFAGGAARPLAVGTVRGVCGTTRSSRSATYRPIAAANHECRSCRSGRAPTDPGGRRFSRRVPTRACTTTRGERPFYCRSSGAMAGQSSSSTAARFLRWCAGRSFMEAGDQKPLSGNFTWRDEFDGEALDKSWLQLRAPQEWFDLRRTAGALTIDPQVTRLDDVATPALLARRQQHLVFDATTQLRVPSKAGTAAGLAAFQNEAHWYFLGTRRVGTSVEVFVEKRGMASAWRLLPQRRCRRRLSSNSGSQATRVHTRSGIERRTAVGGRSRRTTTDRSSARRSPGASSERSSDPMRARSRHIAI